MDVNNNYVETEHQEIDIGVGGTDMVTVGYVGRFVTSTVLDAWSLLTAATATCVWPATN